MRKLRIGNEIWEYSTGKQNVVIKSPISGKKTIVSYTALTGLPFDYLIHKGKCYEEIKPSHIKSYIEKHLK